MKQCFFSPHSRCAAASAGVGQACGDVSQAPAILSLRVGDGAVLLTEVKPELTLVSEMEVTLFTLKSKTKKPTIKRFIVEHSGLMTGEGIILSLACRHV